MSKILRSSESAENWTEVHTTKVLDGIALDVR